ncbi:MAG: acylase, partial [Chitinophagaceae bacterium]
MRQLLAITFLFQFSCSGSTDQLINKPLEEQAARITIIRDSWGIPHVYGKTDADAVFGLMYAQCEENFEKVERAYIEKLGRRAEIDGDTFLYNDLLAQLLYDTVSAKEAYKQSPPEMKKILQAFADGINYFLYKNQGEKPLLLNHFEPWYPYLFTDGAYVSLKTETLSTNDIRRMYQLPATSHSEQPSNEPRGSNGFAIAPSKTVNGKALLYINPHVSFDFRMEAHMVSEEGLNAYGAVTWGQFFVYQGFNEYCGWMHTSSMADGTDLYADYLIEKDKQFYTTYDDSLKPVLQKQVSFRSKRNDSFGDYSLPAYVTHHGPVVGKTPDGKLLS